MKSFKQFNEVAPPGWGHTKAEKEKTDPSKPKSKIGGTAAAFKRALDDGRFKGLPGSKTKKEKTASMFKLMWSMKKKGDKPHYKPGTDKKYKKYQEEQVLHETMSGKDAKKRGVKEDKAFDNVVSMLRKKHGEGSVLTKDSPKPKPQPRQKPKPDTRTPEQKKKDQDHANVMARYGGEANYKAGRGLGT